MSAQPSNPSHLLLSRHPRSPAHPQLAPTWTSRHPPVPSPSPAILGWGSSGASSSSTDDLGRARASSAPIPPPDGLMQPPDHAEDIQEEEEEVIDVHPTFARDAAMPGRTQVIVGRYEFWCHKEILWFASPFFQALLQGSWAETTADYPSYDISPRPSHRNSFITESESDATDTDRDRSDQVEGLPSLPEVSSPVAAPSTLPGGTVYLEPPHLAEEDQDQSPDASAAQLDVGGISGVDNQTASVYLDASEDGPSVAEILRELRELPDLPTVMPSSSSLTGTLQPPPAVGTSAPMIPPGQPPDVPILGEVAFPQTNTQPAYQPLPVRLDQSHHPEQGILLSPPPPRPSSAPVPAPPSAMRKSRRRSSARQSFSSGIRPPSATRLRASASAGRTAAISEQVRVDAVVELHEESAAAFQDFLFWAYPHLECKVTWTNVEDLLALACKLLVPALQKLCEHFLITHASGRPVMALSLAEQHGNAELFREASRFVLDQPTWNPEEMEELSDQTQLKLSQRRTWFLERLLKLGSIDVRKEYTCRPDCPDPARCSFHLDEKWRQAHTAVCRYGPPQPSVAFRCLRQLETFPTNPSLVMPHPLCQSAAKSWVTTLFDRMFQPKAIASPLSPNTEKYWLFITLN